MKQCQLILICGLMLLGCATPKSTSTPLKAEDGSLYRMISGACVTVLKDGKIAGGGAFINAQGDVLTAAHVVHNPADRIEIKLPDGRVVSAKPVASDLGRDLAVLQTGITSRTDGQYLRLAPSTPPPGTPIYVIAAPNMVERTFIPGHIAREHTGFNFLGDLESYVHSLLVIAHAPRGSSGGCWVDGQGRIVGVQSAFVGDDLGSLGLAYISPVSPATAVIRDRQDQPATTLGGELVSLDTQAYGFSKRFPKGSAGAVIHRIFDKSPLKDAGIPTEHLITHVKGQTIHDVDTLYRVIRQHTPGQSLSLTLMAPDSHEVMQKSVTLHELRWP